MKPERRQAPAKTTCAWLIAWICWLAACAVAPSAQAGALTIDWWTINGGGGNGVSTDGRFTLSGTAGQPDAGLMAGSPFFLEGGFWHRVYPGVPALRIIHLPSGDVKVYWPAWAADCVLEQAPTLAAPTDSWSEVSPTIYQSDGTWFFITVPAAADMQFYRLRQVYAGP